MSRYYDVNGNPLPMEDAMALFADAKNDERQIAKDERDGVSVSTVHLVIDHGYGDGPPLIFETMIFGGDHDQDQWRYSTRAEAEEGHRAACLLAFGAASTTDDRAPAVVSDWHEMDR